MLLISYIFHESRLIQPSFVNELVPQSSMSSVPHSHNELIQILKYKINLFLSQEMKLRAGTNKMGKSNFKYVLRLYLWLSKDHGKDIAFIRYSHSEFAYIFLIDLVVMLSKTKLWDEITQSFTVVRIYFLI